MSARKLDLSHIATGLRGLAVPIESLRVDPNNPRLHDERNIDAIAASLKEFGQDQPLVVQEEGMVVRKGNGRLVAAVALGWTHIAAIIVNEAEMRAVARAIADNRSSELAAWDEAVLVELLKALPDDLSESVGFTDDDLAELIDLMDGPPDDTEWNIPDPPDDPITQRGDLWLLGDHRLMCGDSGCKTDLNRLLDGADIHLVNTDPPYNVKVQPRSNNAIAAGLSSYTAPKEKHHQKFDLARHPEKARPTHRKLRAKDRPLINDFVSDEEFDRLLQAWFGNIARVLKPGRGFYIWGGYANCGNYPPVLKTCGLYFSQAIIWHKLHPVLTRKDFMGDHEWCFYGWREGAAHRFYGPNNVPDVWPIQKVNPVSMVHLTEKPVELAARAMRYSSRSGECVLDLFGGSGSTLIAAEQLGRNAFLMEVDPAYCDVIVQRWEGLAGQVAERINSG